MRKIINWFNIKNGMRFWYQVKFIYKDSRGTEVFHYYAQIGLVNKHFILDERELKKVSNLWSTKPSCRRFLQNGKYYAQPVSFLGWFKDKRLIK